MNIEHYPALYRAADDAAVNAQNELIKNHVFSSILLMMGAALAAFNFTSPIAMVGNALLFLGSLALYMQSQYRDYQGKWYKARSLAESVKTATWRLMMCAEPFSSIDQNENVDRLRKLLKELLSENKDIGALIGGKWSNEEQVTDEMYRVMGLSLDDKKEIYLKDRIKNQSDWYADNANYCKHKNVKYFRIVVAVYGVAILFVLLKIAYPNSELLQVELLAVLASSLIAWVQLNRFDELANAYGLTAHEVGIIRSQISSIDDKNKLSDFVCDAENAFSREHTQWAARRDH